MVKASQETRLLLLVVRNQADCTAVLVGAKRERQVGGADTGWGDSAGRARWWSGSGSVTRKGRKRAYVCALCSALSHSHRITFAPPPRPRRESKAALDCRQNPFSS